MKQFDFKQINFKKLIIPNIPYVFIALLGTKIGQGFRLTPGTDISQKILQLNIGYGKAFSSIMPSFNPKDLLIGIAIAVAIRIAVYVKGKNAKKFRKNEEYGSARWGTHDDIAPFIDPVFANNVILTQTERLTMNNRPKDPKLARNKNVLVIGGSGSGKTRFFIKPNLMQMHSSYVVTDPKSYNVVGHRKQLEKSDIQCCGKFKAGGNKKMNKVKYAALYERLSRDDEMKGESNSIVNQKAYLEEYAKAHGIKNYRHFTDDGYSGINFERPGFQAMIAAVESGEVDVVCVKDLSRFGRNYLKVGFYTEMLFPEKGVRFIAINNGVDSAVQTDNDFTPFLNIMNEWYAKDTSNKIRAVFRSRMQNGKRCSGAIPYGYMRDPQDKNHLLIDEEAANVVRRIYQMVIGGMSLKAISDKLTEDKVLIPSAYMEQCQNGNVSRNHSYHNPYRWNSTALAYILERQEYMGHTVLGKTVCENFKTKKRRKATPDELMIFHNTHEAIIDEETWHTAQRVRKKGTRRLSDGTKSHRMAGMVFCADCGAKLSYRSPQSQHRPNGKTYDADSAFCCSSYRQMYRDCTMHFIKASVLEKLVLEAVKKVSAYVFENETDFINRVREQWNTAQTNGIVSARKEISVIEKRISELDNLIKGLYEGNILGKIPDRQLEKLMAQYDDEQTSLEQRLAELKAALEESNANAAKPSKFVAVVKKYHECTELTDEMLNEFVEKIVVHEADKSTGERIQQVDIYFNFIGQFDV
ncbi:MAG: recombinase family protein, partial [Firmicutes bacterium]|nr:recombinase family protein [Bacillota bacterium]